MDNTKFSEVVGNLSEARERHEQGRFDKATEVQFFTDFAALTEAFKPVTIGSLRDSGSSSMSTAKKWFFWGRTISNPTAIVRRFSICSVLALLALLYAQIVWVCGNTILDEFKKVETGWADVETQLTAEKTRILAERKKDEERKKADASAVATAPGKPISSVDDDVLSQEEESPLIEALRSQQVDLVRRAEAIVGLVGKWGRMTVGAREIASLNLPLPPSGAISSTRAGIKETTDLKIMYAAITLNIYSTYFLPLLYGLMGACCYMLREIILAVRTKTYRRDTEMSYWVRLFLGVLAGLAIGWFLRPDTETASTAAGAATGFSFVSLAPMALSFLAGYSVELLFSAMDRLIGAFGSTSKDSPS